MDTDHTTAAAEVSAQSAAEGSAAGQWPALIEQQRASGLAIKAFCQSRGVAPSTFFAWRRRLAERQGTRGAASASSTPAASTPAAPMPRASTPRYSMPAAPLPAASTGQRGFVELAVRRGIARGTSHCGMDGPGRGGPGAWPMELELRAGRRVLLLRPGFDAALLVEVVAALEGVGCGQVPPDQVDRAEPGRQESTGTARVRAVGVEEGGRR